MIGMVAAGTSVGVMFEKLTEKAGEYIAEVIRIGDQHEQFIAQLTALTGSAEQAEASFSALEQMTAKTGIAASGAVDMYKRLTVAAQETGLTNTQVLQMIKTVQDAGIVSGASMSQMASVVDRISISLTTGTVNARLFRTIVSDMPELAKDIADGLHMSVAEMMELVKQGKLSTDQWAVGTLEATEKVDAKLAGMPVSLSRAWGELGGAMDQLIVGINTAIGLTSKLSFLVQAAAAGVRNLLGNLRLGDELTNINSEVKAAGEQVAGLEKTLARLKSWNYAGITTYEIGQTQKQLDAAKVRVQAALEAQKAIQDKANGALAEGDLERHDTAIALAKDREQKITDTVIEHNDKQVALMNKYNKDMADIRKQMTISPEAGGLEFSTGMELLKNRTKEFDDALAHLNETHDKNSKAAENAAKKMQDVVDATGRARDAAVALMLEHQKGKQAIEDVNTQTDINNELVKAGIPLNTQLVGVMKQKADQITANVKATHAANDETKAMTEAEKQFADQQKKTQEANKQMFDELERISESYAKDISTTLVNQLIDPQKGQTILTWFKDLFKKIAAQALETSIILPVTRMVVGDLASAFGPAAVGATGGGQQLFNAAGQVVGSLGGTSGGAGGVASFAGAAGGSGGLFGSGSVLGSLLPVASAANSVSGGSIFSSIGSSLGLTGPGNLFGTGGFLGSGGAVSGFLSQGIGGTSISEAANLAASNAFAPAATGMFGGASVGSLLGGAGAGFAAGNIVNSLLGGKQTGGMVGSGIGAIGGTLIGASLIPVLGPFAPLIGGLIGGTAGGGLGGLIGPGPKHQAWGIDIAAQGGQLTIDRAIGSDTAGLKAAYDDAQTKIAQLNAFMTATGITATAGAILGKGNTAVQPATFDEAVSGQLRFAGPEGSDLAKALANSGGVVQSTQALQDMVTFVTGSYAQLSKTADKTNQYDDAVNTLNTTYADAISKAQSYGLATDKLSSNLADGVAKIRQAQADAVTAATGSVNQALLTAQGRTYEAQTYGMGSGKQKQLDDLQSQLESLGLSAADAAPWVSKLGDAIDLSIQSIKDANALQITTAESQAVIDALNASGMTYRAQIAKQAADEFTAIKSLSDTLKALGVSASDAAPYITALSTSLEAARAASAAANDESKREFQVKNQLALMAAQAGDDPTKKAQVAYWTLIESTYEATLQARDFMIAHGFSTEEMAAEYDKLLKTQKLEIAALNDQAKATAAVTNSIGRTIQEYIDKLNATTAGAASPVNQYAAAQKIFSDQATLAGAGNSDALNSITNNADALLNAAKLMFGSGQGYADVVAMVKKSLGDLPVVQSYNAQLLGLLKTIADNVNAVNTSVGNVDTSVGGVSTGVDNVASDTSTSAMLLATMTTSADATYKQLLAIGQLIYAGDQYLAMIVQNTGGNPFPSARGNVFNAGQSVAAFALGGVVTKATTAPMALMGEAGPEAVLPLTRGPDGRLGVAAIGGKRDSGDVSAAFAQVAIVLRDELRLMRGDIQDMRSTLRRAVAA
jgi:tape measure domain-containing protein